MKHTLKEQIDVIAAIRRNFASHVGFQETIEKEIDSKLNDAASTIAAVNFIGQKKIELLHELIAAAKGAMVEFDNDVDSHAAFFKLKQVLNQMGEATPLDEHRLYLETNGAKV